MFDPKQLLDQFLGSKVPGTEDTVRGKAGQAVQLAKDNPLATGAIAAVLLGTSTGRSVTGSALKLGGLAVVAGLGYQAYKNYKAGKSPEQATPPQIEADIVPEAEQSGFDTDVATINDDFALALMRAMIAAARSDGHVDESERGRIADKLAVSGIADDAQAFINSELEEPTVLDDIIVAARTEEQRVELYTASRLAIDPNTRAERGYLDMLAGRLGLDDALVDHIEATVAGASA
ncbi:tellurite resistance TerB family protein [Hoeflea poritis]|uniref:Tellurite resistance TerB family protein n=1 Tax=Hoeflea poritis TaxID=2993659 RepID=A0ABT4VT29_9HYPH|nr:tellurite resistance TerB family protein [Hoeflea poritis]MDA4847222.1 tellurite resistance TerB family protein [Hoeflea poritis]